MWCCKSFHCQKDSIWFAARTAQFTKVSFIVFVEKSLNGRSRGPCSNPACYASERSSADQFQCRDPLHGLTPMKQRERERENNIHASQKTLGRNGVDRKYKFTTVHLLLLLNELKNHFVTFRPVVNYTRANMDSPGNLVVLVSLETERSLFLSCLKFDTRL